MRGALTFALVNCVLISVFLFCCADPVSPLLYPPVVEVGEIYVETESEVIITVQNGSDSVLVLEDVQASCGCVYVHSHPKTLEPGDEGPIVVKINPALNGPGEQMSTLTPVIRTRGEIRQLKPLLLSFSYQPAITFTPTRLRFTEPEWDKLDTFALDRWLRVEDHRGEDLGEVELLFSHPEFSVVEMNSISSSEVECRVRLDLGHHLQNRGTDGEEKVILVGSDLPDLDGALIVIECSDLSPIELAPPSVRMLDMVPGQVATAEVRVRSALEDLHLSVPGDLGADFRVEIEPKASDEWKVSLWCNVPDEPGAIVRKRIPLRFYGSLDFQEDLVFVGMVGRGDDE